MDTQHDADSFQLPGDVLVATLRCGGALWIRSVRFADEVDYLSDVHTQSVMELQAISRGGEFRINVDLWSLPADQHDRFVKDVWAGKTRHYWEYAYWPMNEYSQPLTGFSIQHETTPGGFNIRNHFFHEYAISFPYWAALIALSILPMRGIFVRRKRRPGICVRCGYDLRATPDRCPECGTQVKPASAAGISP